jgi:hypothetical protein
MGFECRVGEALRRAVARLVRLRAKVLEGIGVAERRLGGLGVGVTAGLVGDREVGRGAVARRRAAALLMGLVTNDRVGRAGGEELDESSEFRLGVRATGDGSKSRGARCVVLLEPVARLVGRRRDGAPVACSRVQGQRRGKKLAMDLKARLVACLASLMLVDTTALASRIQSAIGSALSWSATSILLRES